MLKTIIIQSFHQPLATLDRLAWVKGEVWLAGGRSKQMFSGTPNPAGGYGPQKKLKIPVTNSGGMAWDGKNLIVADRTTKVIHLLDRESGVERDTILLADLKYFGGPEIFRVSNSEVTDIDYGQGHLWATCKAGYSSVIYEIDLKAKKIVSHCRSHGPEPEGISFDTKEEYFWTIDGRNRELSQYTNKGEWTEQLLSTPMKKPRSLGLDYKDTFWTLDLETKMVYNFRKEA